MGFFVKKKKKDLHENQISHILKNEFFFPLGLQSSCEQGSVWYLAAYITELSERMGFLIAKANVAQFRTNGRINIKTSGSKSFSEDI